MGRAPTSVITPACLAVLAFFIAPMSGSLWPALGVVGAMLSIAALGSYVRWKRLSRYSLDALRELHEEGGPPPQDELPDVAEDAGVLCTCCGEPYAAWLLVCPRCKSGRC